MAKRFYLSTRKDRSSEAAPLLDALRAQGWENTFDWSNQDNIEYPDLAVAELEGVRGADVLIVLLPGGYGTHVEIGAALALGKPVILHARDREILEVPYPCVFHYHPSVTLFVSDELKVRDVLAAISPP